MIARESRAPLIAASLTVLNPCRRWLLKESTISFKANLSRVPRSPNELSRAFLTMNLLGFSVRKTRASSAMDAIGAMGATGDIFSTFATKIQETPKQDFAFLLENLRLTRSSPFATSMPFFVKIIW
jgi:hypothetical protein